MCFKVGNAQRGQPPEDVPSRFVAQIGPILPGGLAGLLTVIRHVSDGDNSDERILSRWRHGWVESGRGVDVETGIGWQIQVTDDTVEISAVIIGKKERVRRESIQKMNSPGNSPGLRGRLMELGSCRAGLDS